MAQIKQYIFFDFEMLCSNRGMVFDDMEAIRLGAAKYNIETGEISLFDQFIKPNSSKPLSKFCKKLTGIEDKDLVHANRFDEVFPAFLTWIGGVKKSRFFSWSTSDLTRLKIDANRHQIPNATIQKIETRYIDFQSIFTKRVSKNNPSVENALQFYGLTFEGEKHNPMYDAYNTLRIYLNFLNRPLETDVIMLKQFIFMDVPETKEEINKQLSKHIQQDVITYLTELHDIYKMKDATKLMKRTGQMVKKYGNILINRSGMFTKENIRSVEIIVSFYHELLVTYNEHVSYESKIMILHENIVSPFQEIYLKEA
ncbi:MULTISPECIES: 3'-5' exonuclease [Bacillaceae]|uniref:Exonuclease domain-containing protein n=1 Tax=Evansella alkalicola TaxID=745819 RepID=A0ABS6JU57_9BACI|nr:MULTISPECIES: 3'-5' exonuclease [Bacillaceae]MBU9722076.1 exonuclease domain-containing protein [Bacillus alkalicola]